MSERRRHASEISVGRRMQAPYNFVPLPDAVLLPGEAIPMADASPATAGREQEQDLYSGVLRYRAECLTPVFTRAARAVAEGARAVAAETAQDPSFYHHGDRRRPVLPGSSVRGAIRALLGQLSSARIGRSPDRALFFRGFAGPMAKLYVEKVTSQESVPGRGIGYRSRTQPGILRQGDDGSFQIEPCESVRVPRDLLPNDLYQEHRAGEKIRVPNPRYQGRDVWARLGGPEGWQSVMGPRGAMLLWRREVEELSPELRDEQPRDGRAAWRKGRLVITGDMQSKGAEFVFLRRPDAARVPVPGEVMDRVNSDAQITYWQERAFPPEGHFVDGQAVWYLLGKDRDGRDEVTGLGRAQNFRLRHSRTTRELIPSEVRAPDRDDRQDPAWAARTWRLDLAERLFGTVDRPPGTVDRPEGPLRGRVTFLDAVCETADPLMELKVPQILSSPKPTAYQMYLNQPAPRPEDPKELLHYSSPAADGAEIRGTKLYWHRNRVVDGRRQPLPDAVLFQSKSPRSLSTQDTVIQPVKPGVCFAGEIRFRDLTLLELGALVAAVDLPEGLAHRLGLGKPLGLGSVRLHLLRPDPGAPAPGPVTEISTVADERARYRAWRPVRDAAVAARAGADLLQRAHEALRQVLVLHHNRPGSPDPAVAAGTNLWDLPRSQVLRLMLSYDAAPPEGQTRYVGLDAREDQLKWRNRSVLPGPHQVVQPEQPDPLTGAGGAAPGTTPGAALRPASAQPSAGRQPGPRLQPGLVRVKLLSRKERGVWRAEGPGGVPVEVRRVREGIGVQPGATVQVLVSAARGESARPAVADFVALLVQRPKGDG